MTPGRPLDDAHPDSLIRYGGRTVELKAHKATWSGAHPPNSLAGLRECFDARVARTEIDFRLFRGDLVVSHDEPRGEEILRLAEALAIVREAPPGPTVLMLDAKDEAPWSPEVTRLVADLIAPVRDRIFVGSPADWNLRRLREADPLVALTFDPMYYFEAKGSRSALPGARGAYGYHDVHPLALRRALTVAEYLRERVDILVGQVPHMREIHIRLALFEEMLDDRLNACEVAHAAGVRVDVWTLDAGTERWSERLSRALDAGVDIVTTNTPRALAEAARSLTVSAAGAP